MVVRKETTDNIPEFHQHFSSHVPNAEANKGSKNVDLTSSVKSLLDESPVKTAIVGDLGVGKSFLLNVLLEYTSPSEREYSSIVSGSKGLRGLFSAPPAYRQTNYDFLSNDLAPSGFSFSSLGSSGSPSSFSSAAFSAQQPKPYTRSSYKNSSYSFSGDESSSSPLEPNAQTSHQSLIYDNKTIYSFSAREDEEMNVHQFQWEIGKIEETFMPNGDYMNSIQWEKELNHSQTFTIDDYHTFLLPQGLSDEQFLSFCCIDIRYGSIPELMVSFAEENELRMELWSLHELESGDKSSRRNASSTAHRRFLEKWYRNVLQLRKEQHVPVGNVFSARDFVFPFHVRHLLGKTYRFRGTGFNFHVDRIYIREKLRELITTHGAYVKKMVIKIPCGLLKGNRELVELPSLDLPTSFSSRLSSTVDGTNVLLVAVDEKGFTPLLQQFLSTNFSSTLLKNPDQQKTIFVELAEVFSGIQMVQHLFDLSTRERAEAFKSQTLSRFRVLLQSQSSNYFCDLDQIISATTSFSLKPRMFSFLHRQRLPPTALIQNYPAGEAISATFIPALLGAINSMALTQCAQPLKVLNRSWMDKKAAAEQIPPEQQQTPKLLREHPLSASKPIALSKHQGGDIAHNLEKLSISPPRAKALEAKALLPSEELLQHENPSSFSSQESAVTSLLLHSQTSTSLNDKPDLQIVQVKNDENSQFRALAFLLYGTEDAHSICRLLVMNEVLSCPDYYRKFLEARNANSEIHEYVSVMAEIDQPGDVLTLYAFSNAYDIDILVHSPIHPQPRLIQPRNAHASRSYSLILLPNNIYKPLTPKASPVLLDPNSHTFHYPAAPVKSFALSGLLSPLRGKLMFNGEDSGEEQTLSDRMEEEEEREANSLYSPVKAACTSVVPTKLFTPRPLTELCIISIGEHIELLPNLVALLPEELLHKILQHLVSSRRLVPAALLKFLHPSLVSLDLSNWLPLTDYLCGIIGQKSPNLRELSVAGCLNIGPAAVEHLLTHCPELEALDLSGCTKIDDAALQTLARRCSRLSSCNLSECTRITDASVAEIFANTLALERLTLRGCINLTDAAFLSASSQMMYLRELDLSGCERLTDQAVLQIAKTWAPRLTVFKLSSRNVTDCSIVEFSRQSPQLVVLVLNGCEMVTDLSIQSIIKSCPLLEVLGLAGCRCLTDNAFLTPYRLVHLHELDLSRCLNITDVGVTFFAHTNPNLTALNLAFCDAVTDASVSQLGMMCPSLADLNVSKCLNVTGHALTRLAAQLRHRLLKLTLYHCDQILSRDAVLQLAFACGQLRHLDLSFCRSLTDELLETIAIGCPFLEELSVEECVLGESGINALATCCHNMKKLKLGYVQGVTDNSLAKLAEGCQFISLLDISYCPSITREGLQSALDCWLDLRTLHLRGLHQLTARGVRSHSLQELNMSWCRNLQDSALEDIWKGCFNLVHLDLQWASQITANPLLRLVQNLPTLRSLNLRGCPKASPSLNVRAFRDVLVFT